MSKFPSTYVFPDANGCDYYVVASSREEAAAAINADRSGLSSPRIVTEADMWEVGEGEDLSATLRLWFDGDDRWIEWVLQARAEGRLYTTSA
jgi:hypothetical protein